MHNYDILTIEDGGKVRPIDMEDSNIKYLDINAYLAKNRAKQKQAIHRGDINYYLQKNI